MKIRETDNLLIAVYAHRWRRPRVWTVLVPADWKETMACLGLATVHYERRVSV